MYSPRINQWSILPSMHVQRSGNGHDGSQKSMSICCRCIGHRSQRYVKERRSPIERDIRRKDLHLRWFQWTRVHEQCGTFRSTNKPMDVDRTDAFPSIRRWYRRVPSTYLCAVGVTRTTVSLTSCTHSSGGFNGSSRMNSGERYDPTTNTWTSIPDMFNPRSNFALEVVDVLLRFSSRFSHRSSTIMSL
jgi:hypothetical protein